MQDLYQVIKTIRLSEKASLLQELNNEYVFKVDKRSNKKDIARAVEKLFGKKVATVRTLNVRGKERRKKQASRGRTASWKKAIVRLKDGETLDLA